MGMFDDLIEQHGNKGRPIGDVAIGQFPVPTDPENVLQPKENSGGMFDDLIEQFGKRDSAVVHDPRLGSAPSIPTGPAPEREGRFGDSLKPIFGGRNPVAESFDTFVKPLTEISSDRPALDRVQDTLNFAGSVPFQALRLPTPGQAIEAVTGSTATRESEERFVENNPKLLRAIGAAGEVSVGLNPLGQGFRTPSIQARTPQALQKSPQIKAQVADDVTRARQSAQDMVDLDVKPFGPAVAAAKRGDNSPGAITQALQDKPVVGTPLQRGAQQFVDEMVQAQDNIRSGFGSSQTMQGAGGQVRAALDDARNGRRVDVFSLDSAQLDALAKSPPRLSTYKDVQAAKYLRAERFLPEDKAKAQPVAKGQERVIGGMENTRGILRDIKRRFGLTINKSEAARARKSRKGSVGDELSLENTVDFSNPRWTGSANVDRSLDAIAAAKGNWRTGIEGMREIRSNIRRVLASKGDTEVNALAKGDLNRLYGAVSRDMDTLLTRLSKDATAKNRPDLARRYQSAKEAYKDADTFTARHAQRFEDVKTLFRVQSDEAVAGAIKTAMQDGTKGNLQRLVSLRKIVPKEVIDEMASALIVDLGRPTGRARGATQEAGFTPSRFASQWNSLSPAARKIMFGHRPQLSKALDRFSRVAQNISDYEALVNNSRTGVSNAVWATLGAGGVGLSTVSPLAVAGVMLTMSAGRGAASFLASPAYVNWLTRTTTIMQRGGQPGAIARQLKSLGRIVSRDKDLNPQLAQSLLLSITEASQGGQ